MFELNRNVNYKFFDSILDKDEDNWLGISLWNLQSPEACFYIPTHTFFAAS